MGEITYVTNKDIVRISSTEVKDMMDIKEHKNLLRKIEQHNEYFTKLKIEPSRYWIEGTYKDVTGRKLKDYKISKKGCEFLSHKTTGEKGDLFTIKYMDRFEVMEEELKVSKVLSPIEQLRLQYEVLENHEVKMKELEQDIDDLRDNAPLYNIECDELIKSVRKAATRSLGGYKSKAYNNKSLRAKVYQDIQHQLRREFGVESYKAIKRCQLEKALKISNGYELPFYLEEQVTSLNNQLVFNEA